MCVIVDANCRDLFFSADPPAEALPVRQWVVAGNGCVVIGGLLLVELSGSAEARRILATWKRSGKALAPPDARYLAESAVVSAMQIQSDDPHVLALARASGARTLYSHDVALHADFTDPAIINDPRGSVYQTPAHRHLLVHTSGCLFSKGA